MCIKLCSNFIKHFWHKQGSAVHIKMFYNFSAIFEAAKFYHDKAYIVALAMIRKLTEKND